MNSAYISIFVAANLTLGSFLFANYQHVIDSQVNGLNQLEQVQFLEELAQAEKNTLQINTIAQESIKESLNAMHETIMGSDDLELISLFQRAVRNFNSSSSVKANPVAIYYKHYRNHLFNPQD